MKWLYLSLMMFFLTACVTSKRNTPPGEPQMPIITYSKLELGKQYFERGYYKRAMRDLLPMACDGLKEAQYAVGYMYYYGYGVAQDIEVGYFWIKRSADQGFKPAIEALKVISWQGEKDMRWRKHYKAIDP